MRALLNVIILALQLYTYLIVASAILSWLVAFNVVNTRNDFVRSIWNFLDAVTEPVLRPIRNILPNLGGVDISPIILILLIIFILQNQDQVAVRYFGLEGFVPLGMALFIASVTGGVLVAVAGGARILQLRRNAHRARSPQPK